MIDHKSPIPLRWSLVTRKKKIAYEEDIVDTEGFL